MSEKKMVSRNVAIALGIICIILVVGLGGVMAYYVNDLTSTLNLGKSTVWVDEQTISQPDISATYWTESANYAGYVSIYIHSSTSGSNTVEVVYSEYGVSFSERVVVFAGKTAAFPILPSSNIIIGIWSDVVNGSTETVTITYHY